MPVDDPVEVGLGWFAISGSGISALPPGSGFMDLVGTSTDPSGEPIGFIDLVGGGAEVV